MAEPGDPHTPDDLTSTPSDDGARATSSGLRPTWPTPVRAEAPASREDPHETGPQDHAHDDLIGFTSHAALAGSPRREPLAVPRPPIEPDLYGAEADQSDADLFDPLPVRSPASVAPARSQSQSQTQPIASPEPKDSLASSMVERTAPPTPAWAIETPASERRPASERATPERFGRARTTEDGRRIPPNAPPEGAMGLYTVYALILFAVPTLGVAAVVALIAIYGRSRPKEALALSHHLFQQRTIWTAAIVAVVGVLMIAVNLGVFVLFFVALWVLVRGAAGLLRLSGGRPIPNPKTWLI